MAKNKFFYNKVYNVRRNIINIVIIGVCVIGIIICFILTSKFQSEHTQPNSTVNIKSEVIVEINQKYDKEIFFSKLENINLDDIDITYPKNFDISKPGQYNIIIKINGKNYDTKLSVVDTEKPELNLKNLTINENESYNVNSFVSSCSDNSNKECNITFYNNAYNEDGTKVDYSSYKTNGTYNIRISAKDESGNETVKDTTLTIKKKNETIVTPTPTTPETCKYGDTNYDKEKFIIAVYITSNNCAVSLDLYNNNEMVDKINKIMDNETIRIKKDVNLLNLNGRLALNRQVSAIFNESGNGLIGYELTITVNISSNNETTNIVTYKVNSEGKRVFSNNPYNLSE